MLVRSSRYAQALARPHRVYTRVDVHAGTGELLYADLPFTDGGVAATLSSRVARRMSMSVSEEFYPVSIDGLLAPFGNELRAYRGIAYGDGLLEYWPVFRGRIFDVELSDVGDVSVFALDRAGDVVGADFTAPHITIEGPIADEYRRIVREVLPDAEFTLMADISEQTPFLIFESDRAQSLDELMNAAGAFWYPLADGTFTAVKVPWTRANPAVFELADGPDGTVRASQLARSREQVYNMITVNSELTDGSLPVTWTARDDDPSSPTSVLGGFGIRARQVALQSVATEAQARSAAETMLRRSKALTETVGLEVVPDASIELGDTFTARVRGRVFTQCVAGFSLPLTADASMTVECRVQTPGDSDA